MNVRWEKRRNGYFAYARHSYHDKDEKKTKTLNKYLGADIKTAVANFKKFAEEQRLGPETITTIVLDLERKGRELGVRTDDYLYDNRDFNERFYQTFGELKELILEAETAKKRKELQAEFIQFFSDIVSFVNSQKR